MSATVATFRKYLNPVFLETGSHTGDGIQQALDAGFEKVYSVELSVALHEQCCNRFKGNYNVVMYLGDSHQLLDSILQHIRKPVTFWLDAHYSGEGSVMGQYYSPLLQELEAIRHHTIHTHTILIDDVRLWHNWGLSIEGVKDKLLEINPDYKFVFEDGFIRNDILVATL